MTVDGAEVSQIGVGMLVLLGIAAGDGPAEAERIAAKLARLRIFNDGAGRMNEALGEREVLCVSQFTLLADTRRGNRPSFVDAASPERAEELYERVCELLEARRGVFGARMEVSLVNDGPVTIPIEIKARG